MSQRQLRSKHTGFVLGRAFRCCARLRAAGAIIVGRTGMVEFAFGGVGINPHYGTPKNPWDRASGGRIPGGSSSGAAVAVADGMYAMSLPHPHHQPQPQPQHEHHAG